MIKDIKNQLYIPDDRIIPLLPRPAAPPMVILLLNMGAFRNMSGSIIKRTFDPLTYTFSI